MQKVDSIGNGGVPEGGSASKVAVSRKRKLAEVQITNMNAGGTYSSANSNHLNGSQRISTGQQSGSNRVQINGSGGSGSAGVRTKESIQRQQQYETLLDLYGDNYCACQNDHCKNDLSSKFKGLLKTKISKTLFREFTQIITGSIQKHSAKLFRYFLKFLEDEELNKELLDELLQLFVVLFLQSEESVKVTVLQDLDSIFKMLKSNQTKIFVDRSFKYKIFFFGISQYQHCSAKMEAGKA